MYNFDISPHPFGFLFYLESNIKTLKEDHQKNLLTKLDIIPDDIYAILILPKSSLHLLDEKYLKKIDDNLNFLYSEEICEECIKFHKILGDYHKKLLNSDDKKYANEIRKKIGNISVHMINHKQIHKNISAKEINYVIKYLMN
jgi:hypothetical protein